MVAACAERQQLQDQARDSRAFTHDVGARLASDSRLANLHTETQAARDMTLAVKLPTPLYEQFARLPHRCGNSRATWHHTVLPATRQR